MKHLLVIIGLISFLAVPALGIAASPCVVGSCDDPNTSPTKAIVTMDGKDNVVCGVAEAYETAFVKREGAKSDDLNNQAVPIQVRDFESGKMFNFYDGYYVIECTMSVENSGFPLILGFSTLDRANEWWKAHEDEYGGRVANFETATREYKKAEAGPSTKNISKQDAAAKMVEKLLEKKKK